MWKSISAAAGIKAQVEAKPWPCSSVNPSAPTAKGSKLRNHHLKTNDLIYFSHLWIDKYELYTAHIVKSLEELQIKLLSPGLAYLVH